MTPRQRAPLCAVALALSSLLLAMTPALAHACCGSYKYTKKGEGSEWSMGNVYLYFQGYYIYLHVSTLVPSANRRWVATIATTIADARARACVCRWRT